MYQTMLCHRFVASPFLLVYLHGARMGTLDRHPISFTAMEAWNGDYGMTY